MISVLIPIFNYNVTNLVYEIHRQLEVEGIDFEIICIDDCSTIDLNDNLRLAQLKKVEFIQLPNNVGRSKIRNLLASKANYEWLLFLDSDVMPESNFFIKSYIEEIEKSNEIVFCGGVLYEESKPASDLSLRWIYGKRREVIDFRIRQKQSYNFFLGANFLIHSKVFESVTFNESIVKYGYEDNLFAKDLKLHNINLKQVKNRVYHLGLEKNEIFLNKTKVALENLKALNELGFVNIEYIRLLKVFKSVKIGTPIFKFIWAKFNKKMEGNLKSKNPSMYLFDIYKLSYFCYIND
jgi:glycosyltransferase involved in cell wall biosynthesis